ncbi:flavin mononucleotide hydrolase 1, chloroplatic isoform X2 [Elaeis guineensis]|uniref:Flavin mononucleotide hydrolase 1, chloroplatic isoform X2 n=1 Tax=Elaeis guineensis var. tenera TaxID=51953 RepID=A0A6I9RQ58_ELAGV|nr:flavin mononucleotide hydrolase 1, chloroplatic isoform X2 [Elaeis guineensis]
MSCLFRPPAVSPLFPKPTASRPRLSMAASCSTSGLTEHRKLPVLLFDIMDTIVRDPFYHDIPAFFQMSMKELLESKHPTAWVEFEMGLIDENELAKKFFKDGRPFDLEGLKQCMLRGYSYIDGIEELLHSLKQNNYELHAFTNYPIWYKMIEEKLQLSKYLSWTFCSCIIGGQMWRQLGMRAWLGCISGMWTLSNKNYLHWELRW